VIVIPGILGSQLINSKTGEIVWPSLFRSSADVLPLSPDLQANRDDLIPGKIVETVHFGKVLPEVYVYRDLLEALRHYAGYRDGDWNSPGSDGDRDTFYVFAYDWRRDNVENARELVKKIQRLKEQLKRPDLRFTILAHSMGGLIARYAAMYGNADIPPGDVKIVPTWAGAADISRIVMIGVPNEGSADALATLIDGYSITEGLRRRVPLLNKLTAEDAMRSPAVFQLLPHRRSARILDENLKSSTVNLYDPEVWKQYGWSVISNPEFRKRYARGNGENAIATLDLYFAAVLQRAKRFHEALDALPDGEPPVLLLAIGGDCEETLDAPVVLRDTKLNRWVTLIRPREYSTSSGRKVTKRELTYAMYAPGDGRVTRSSLLGQDLAARRNSSVLASPLALTYAVFGCDLHGQLQRNKSLQDNALTAVVAEAMN
jgi:pimeloyl-ACP methyl ester carboxylesterase